MAKFKVLLERIETITHLGEVMVEASTAEEARRIILSDLFVDPGSYDEHLEPVESEIKETYRWQPRRAEKPPRRFPGLWRAELSEGGEPFYRAAVDKHRQSGAPQSH
jgi:hypothetical protein